MEDQNMEDIMPQFGNFIEDIWNGWDEFAGDDE